MEVQIAYLEAAINRLKSDPSFELSLELMNLLRKHLDPNPVETMTIQESDQFFELAESSEPRCGLEIFGGTAETYTTFNQSSQKRRVYEDKLMIKPDSVTFNRVMNDYFPMTHWKHFIVKDAPIDRKYYYKCVNYYYKVKDIHKLTQPLNFIQYRDLCTVMRQCLYLNFQQIEPGFMVFEYNNDYCREHYEKSFPFNDEVTYTDSLTMTIPMPIVNKLIEWLDAPFPFPRPTGDLRFHKIENIFCKEAQGLNYGCTKVGYSLGISYYDYCDGSHLIPHILEQWCSLYPKLINKSGNSCFIEASVYDCLYDEYEKELIVVSASTLQTCLPSCLVSEINSYLLPSPP